MLSSSLFAAALSLAVGVQAHMSITFPPPFDAPTNPAANPKNVDINAPINAAGFPCRGLHKKGVPSAATLIAGAESKITFSKGAPHAGGSCQVALSYDQTSFYVIHSWQGGCPVDGEGSLSFTVPSDAPTGPATFAWTWINKLGNREFYMNCGAVTIAAGTGPAPKIPFKSRPDLFVANLDNGCKTPDSTDTTYPDPGPDVTGTGPGNPLKGCQPVNGIGNSVRGGGAGGSPPVEPPVPNPSVSSSLAVSQPASSVISKSMTSVVLRPSSSSQPASSAPSVSPPASSTPITSQTSTSGTQRSPGKTSSFPLFTSSPTISIPTTLPSGESSVIPPSEGLITITEYTTLSTFPTSAAETPSQIGNLSTITEFTTLSTLPSSSTEFSSSTFDTNSTTIATPTPTATNPTTPDESENLEESTDGTCGGIKKCRADFCCSAASFCGNSTLHCGAGCQTVFGKCGSTSRRSSPLAYYYHGHRRRFHGTGVAGRIRV